MSEHRLAHLLVKLYPQAWRDRYEAEMLGLLADTDITFSIVTDLAAGVVREWMHVMMQQPGTPVSIEREFGRDFVRSVGGTIALAGLASLLAAVLPRAGVNVPSWPYAILGVEFAIILRIGIVFLYRFKKVYRATMAYQPVPAEVLTDFAVSRAEFWIWTALLTAACTVSARNGFSLLILPVAIDWICGATKLELVRRARVKQLAIERYMTWKNRESLGNS